MRWFFLFFVFCLSGCAAWSRTFFASDLLELRIGMSKDEVIRTLNKPQDIVLARQYKDGFLEIYEYVEKPFYLGRVNPTYWKSYWVIFVDEKLKGWERADTVNAQKMLQRIVEAQLAIQAMDAIKGTTLMPLHHEINATIKSR